MSSAQLTGTICVGLAALIYLLPLQNLLWEFAHKKNDSAAGLVSGLIILVTLWLLLLVALLSVTATGGFDWLRFGRPALYALLIASTLNMAVASGLFIGLSPRTPLLERIVICAPVYLFPLVTMLLVILSLHPGLAPDLSPRVFRLPWMIGATLSITACLALAGYQLSRSGGNRLAGVVQRMRSSAQAKPEQLAQIAALDPQNDFGDLLRLSSQYQRRAVRDAATTRLRLNPGFLDALITQLNARDSSNALEFIYRADFSPDELTRLAGPTRQAIERFTKNIPAPNYLPPERRKQLQLWGRETLRDLAKKFATTTVDFGPALAAFDEALEPTTRDN